MTITVPGNLLLAGEYAITCQGGLGLAIAVPQRITLTTQESRTFEVISLFENTESRWENQEGELFTALLNKAREYWEISLPAHRLIADSRSFSDSQGRKMGFGSSAAVSVAFSAYLYGLAFPEQPWDRDRIFSLALEGHRAFQGGKGSGYDVAASLYGGIGLFTGGTSPQWDPLPLPYWPPCYLLYGDNPVKTTSSIGGFRAFQRDYPQEFSRFFSQNQRFLEQLTKQMDTPMWLNTLGDYKKMTQDLGLRIGSPADPPEASRKGWAKSLGAGNEVAVFFPQNPQEDEDFLEIEPQGVLWKS